ncbi:hypothetical protein [Amycolatopsis orientalis]|uniref:hypothetical protein n=1 Tax=Amycolatopsis orientalis TaxID=31958 RepID=UPI0004005B0B|nr:hypothetical protein [Amycolatopsis orientalis]
MTTSSSKAIRAADAEFAANGLAGTRLEAISTALGLPEQRADLAWSTGILDLADPPPAAG